MADQRRSQSPELRRRIAAAGAATALCIAFVLSGACPQLSQLSFVGNATPAPTLSSWDIVPTQPPAQTNLHAIVPSIDRLVTATSIHIMRSWTGLNPAAPFRETYPLTLQGEQFVGLATVQAGRPGIRTRTHEKTGSVSVPADLVRRHLQKLAGIAVINGRYVPRTQWTDDYPETQMLLTQPDGQSLRFFSTSQGALQIPWGVESGGQTFTVHGGAVAAMFADLEPYLLRPVLHDLVKTLEQEYFDGLRREDEQRERATREAVQSPTPSPAPLPR